MEIVQLYLKHFGRFTDYRLDLNLGINVISGANESGKSTLHAFIRAMLYGITRTRSKSLDEYQLRQPWENPSHFAGSMKLRYKGKIYRIDRNFYRKEESVEVVCETDGTVADDPLAAIRYFTGGLSEADFCNTLFIRQAQPGAGAQLGDRLRDYLVNREQTADETLDVSAVQELLKKKRRKTEGEKNAALNKIEEEIRAKSQESEYVSRDLERLMERRSGNNAHSEGPGTYERITGQGGRMPDGADAGGVSAASPSGEGPAGGSAARQGKEDPGGDLALSPGRSGLGGSAGEAARSGLSDTALEDDPQIPEEPVETAGVLLPVMVLLSFAAAGLMLACAFLTTDHRMRYAAAAGAFLIGIVAVSLLLRLIHPVPKSERLRRKLKREAFLDRHLGFREDPEDSMDRELSMRREMRTRDAILRAREEEEKEERSAALMEEEELARRGREAERIARSEVFEREISQRREKLDHLREELEELYRKKAALSSYDVEIQAIGLAQARIAELAGSIYHESGAEFARDVSLLLSKMTGGGYTRISLDEKMLVRLNTPDRLLTLDQVSYGTMQQVYFALRLASAGLLSGDISVPVILDEPFAMYDEERLESALRFLSGCGRQVILFSCQRRELEMLSKLQTPSRGFRYTSSR